MADISKIVLPNGSPYDLVSKKTRGIYRGQMDNTSTSTAFTTTINGITQLYDGLLVSLFNPVIASAEGCTININNLGAKGIWASQQNAAVSTAIGKNTQHLFMFDAGHDRWIKIQGTYTANSNTIGEYGGACIAGPGSMARYSLMMQTTLGTWESVVTTSSTGTGKVKSSSGFLLTSPILYQSAGTYAAGSSVSGDGAWTTKDSFDTRYSANVSNSWSVLGRPFFLVGTISNHKFYLKDTTWWADSFPNSDDGYYYWYVGQMRDGYTATLYPVHPIYYYKNGRIQTYSDNDDKYWQYNSTNDCIELVFPN